MKTLFVGIYRPPSTNTDEWNSALINLNESIALAQAKGGYDTIICGGDLNFPNLKWELNLPKIDLNLTNQEENFVNFIFTHNLMNYVNLPTRNGNILDLILTNDYDLIVSTNFEVNSGFSDHNTVTCG